MRLALSNAVQSFIRTAAAVASCARLRVAKDAKHARAEVKVNLPSPPFPILSLPALSHLKPPSPPGPW